MPFSFGWKAFLCPRRGVPLVSPFALGRAPLFPRPRRGVVLSANLLTKVPAFFKNWGTRGQGSPSLAHFTYKS